jgi:hypothetical protein
MCLQQPRSKAPHGVSDRNPTTADMSLSTTYIYITAHCHATKLTSNTSLHNDQIHNLSYRNVKYQSTLR